MPGQEREPKEKRKTKLNLKQGFLNRSPIPSYRGGGRGKDKKATFHSGGGCISGTAGEPRAAGAGCSTADRLQQVQSSLGKP